jgi:hypothetical protein
MESLIKVLLNLTQKVPWLTEVEKEVQLDLLRAIEKDLGVSGVVPPTTGPTNAPLAVPAVPVPGPVAAPDSSGAKFTPPVSGEVPEANNAFAR